MVINLAKKMHARMGYPLGKLHYKLQLFMGDLSGLGSPLRHVRRVGYRAKNFRETIARRLGVRQITKDIAPEEAAQAKELRKNGFCYFTAQIDPKLMDELLRYFDEVVSKRSEHARSIATHPFFFPLDDPQDHTTDSIVIRFALQDSILRTLTAYFGCVPFLNGASFLESRSVDNGCSAPRASQQWHLDYSAGGGDQVGVWVHLTDVNTPDQGPFTYMPIPASKKVKNGIFPGRIKDEQIEASGLNNEIRRALGPKGTCFIINTLKCYHMGSRLAPGERRIICHLLYVMPGPDREFIKVTTPVPEEKKLLLSR